MPVPTKLEDVVKYLVKEYGMDPEQATKLAKRRQAIYWYGISLRSYTYYIAEEMLRAEGKGLPDDAEYVPYEMPR